MCCFSVNTSTKTVTIHKNNCKTALRHVFPPSGILDTGDLGEQRWFSEQAFSLSAVDDFVNHLHWAFIPCDICMK